MRGKTSGQAKSYARGRKRIPYYIFLRQLASLRQAPKNGDSFPAPRIALSLSLNVFPRIHDRPPPRIFSPPVHVPAYPGVGRDARLIMADFTNSLFEYVWYILFYLVFLCAV